MMDLHDMIPLMPNIMLFALCVTCFGFQNQSPLPRRPVPNAGAGAWGTTALSKGREEPSKRHGDVLRGRSGGWFWNHESPAFNRDRRARGLGGTPRFRYICRGPAPACLCDWQDR